MRGMVVTQWWLVVVWLVACGPAIPPLPSRGGPAWLELKSEHFTVWTDATAERGHELVREMEHRRQIIMRAMNNVRSKATSFVIALRDAREVAAYLPKQFIALAWNAENPTGQPGIVVPANNNDRDHIVSHELTHVISYGSIANQPHWLSEGIATYFEMADLDSDETSVKIGMPRDDRARLLRGSPPLSVAELFACKDPRCMNDIFYATSWALFSFLLNEHFDQFGRYLQRLNDGPSDGQAEAWHDAFPDLPLDKLDSDLTEWLVTGKLALPRIAITVRDYPATARPLGDGDVLAARSLLRLMVAQDEAATRVEAEAALATDRTNVLARLIETAVTHAIAPEDARATAAAHPDDWRAWRLVAIALRGSPEGAAALGRMCGLTTEDLQQCAHVDRQAVPNGPSK
jgi:hypothetical protein